MTCVCRNAASARVATVGSVIQSLCSPADQLITTTSLQQLCIDLVPSLAADRRSNIVATFALLLALSWVAVILRYVSRHLAAASYGIDDCLIIAALVFNTGFNALQIWATHNGSGRHQLWLSFAGFIKFNKIVIGSEICFALSVTAAKISLLYSYNRLFRTPRFPTIAMSIGFVILIWPPAFAVCIVLNCKPISFAWDKTIPNGHCLDLAVIYFSLSGISTFIDVILLLLPIPWLWGLQMNRQKKLSLIAAFILGGFVCIAGIVRLVFINKLVYQDITWTLTETSV